MPAPTSVAAAMESQAIPLYPHNDLNPLLAEKRDQLSLCLANVIAQGRLQSLTAGTLRSMKPTTVHSMIEYRHGTMIAVTTSVKSTETGTGKMTYLSTMAKESPVVNLNLDLETGHHLHAPAVEVGVETTPENDLVAGSKTEDPPVGGETEDPLVGDETKPKEGLTDLTVLSAVRGETRARDDLALPVLSARRDRRHHNHLLILLFPKLAVRAIPSSIIVQELNTSGPLSTDSLAAHTRI